MSSLQILIQDQIAYSRWNFCFMKGFSELDDVIHNTVGCLIGWFMVKGSRFMVKDIARKLYC